MDNGPEFTSKALDPWAYLNRVELDFSRPGRRHIFALDDDGPGAIGLDNDRLPAILIGDVLSVIAVQDVPVGIGQHRAGPPILLMLWRSNCRPRSVP